MSYMKRIAQYWSDKALKDWNCLVVKHWLMVFARISARVKAMLRSRTIDRSSMNQALSVVRCRCWRRAVTVLIVLH